MSRERGWIERAGHQVDRLVRAFAPGWAWKCVQAKAAAELISSYHGGANNRLRRDWVPGAGSVDVDLLPYLASMRERSRDLNRNDPHAAGITGTVINTAHAGETTRGTRLP